MAAPGTSYTAVVRARNAVGAGPWSASKSATSGADAGGAITPFTLSKTALTKGDSVTVTTATAVDALTASVNGVAQTVAGSGTTWTISNLAQGGLTINATKGAATKAAKALVANTGATTRPLTEPYCYIGASMTNDLHQNIQKAIQLSGGVGNGKYTFRSASGLTSLWDNDGVDTAGNADNNASGIPSMKTALAIGDRKVFMAGDISGGDYDHITYGSMYKWDELLTRNGVTDRYFYQIHHSDMPSNTEVAGAGLTSGSQASFVQFWEAKARKNLIKKQEFVSYYNDNRVPGTKPIWVIPVLEIYLAIYDAIQAGTNHSEISSMGKFFLRGSNEDGHMKDVGLYLVALAHFAAVWRTKPTGMFFNSFYPTSLSGVQYSDACSAWLIDTIWSVISTHALTGLTDTWTYPTIAARAGMANSALVGVTTPGAETLITSNGTTAIAFDAPKTMTAIPAGSVTLGSDNNAAITAAMLIAGLGTGAANLRSFSVKEKSNTAVNLSFPAGTQAGDRMFVIWVSGTSTTKPFYNDESRDATQVAIKAWWGNSQTNVVTRSGVDTTGATDRTAVTYAHVLATEANLADVKAITNTAAGFFVTLVTRGNATITSAKNTHAADTEGGGIVRFDDITIPALPAAVSGDIVFTSMTAIPAAGYGIPSTNIRRQWWFKPARMVTDLNSTDLTATQKSGKLIQFGLEYPDGALAAETVRAVGRYPWAYEMVRLLIHPAA